MSEKKHDNHTTKHEGTHKEKPAEDPNFQPGEPGSGYEEQKRALEQKKKEGNLPEEHPIGDPKRPPPYPEGPEPPK